MQYIEKENIPLPALYIIDGATCHVSYEMAELCKKNGIEPILLRPNTTHLTQALDLTFFASLKAGLKVAQELWHRDPVNIGFSLSKYTVINLVHSVTENILHDKPELIAKGFRKAGIVPWNPLAPTTDRMTPSMVYAQPEEQMLVQDQPQHQTEEVREKGGRKGQECADLDQEGLLDVSLDTHQATCCWHVLVVTDHFDAQSTPHVWWLHNPKATLLPHGPP